MLGLLICTYNRSDYFRQCVNSLLMLERKPDMIVVYDDASTDTLVRVIAKDLARVCENMHFVENPSNRGIKNSMKRGCELLFSKGCDMVVNLDGDAIVKPNFLSRLIEVYDLCGGECIVSGFNCDHPVNPILQYNDEHGVAFRKHANGINMCFSKSQYDSVLSKSLNSDGNWDYNSAHKMPFAITVPSVVQHIGLVSSMGHNVPDVAKDY